MILPALRRGGYEFQKQVKICDRPGGGTHKVDAVAEKDGTKWIISLKWQQVGGTAEQKVPFEVMCLMDAMATGEYSKAYLVLGGDGWKLREFYVSGGLQKYLRSSEGVEIVTLERFVATANKGML